MRSAGIRDWLSGTKFETSPREAADRGDGSRCRNERQRHAIRLAVLSLLLALTFFWAESLDSKGNENLEPALAPPPRPIRLVPGKPATATIDHTVQDRISFDCLVPDDAVELSVSVDDATVDLDCYVRFGCPIDGSNLQADHQAATGAWNERLRISRWDDPPLLPGRCYLDVAYTNSGPPRIDGMRTERLPFSVRVDVIRARSHGTLAPSLPAQPTVSVAGTLDRANGNVLFYTVTVPEEAPTLRLDVGETGGDVDLLVRRAAWPLTEKTVDIAAATLAGQESLVLDAQTQPPLTPGTWHVAVLNQTQSEVPVPIVLHATLGRDPPASLLAIPAQPVGRTPLECGLYATVAVLNRDNSCGSGVLVTRDGLFLTNHHVVAGLRGKVPKGNDVIVGLTFDPRRPARECFRATVLCHDEALDLALCEIRAGLYGQPLPTDYVFHPVALGNSDSVGVGDRLDVIGFPDIGGVGSRVSVSYSSGCVAGFMQNSVGYFIKTDATVSPGSSGGAALNAEGRLVGLPSHFLPAANMTTAIGYIRPLSLLPADWRALIDGRLAK